MRNRISKVLCVALFAAVVAIPVACYASIVTSADDLDNNFPTSQFPWETGNRTLEFDGITVILDDDGGLVDVKYELSIYHDGLEKARWTFEDLALDENTPSPAFQFDETYYFNTHEGAWTYKLEMWDKPNGPSTVWGNGWILMDGELYIDENQSQ